MGRETTSLFDQRVYAQATPPQDTRDGIIWVDTSLADKPTKVYSADTQSFVAVGIADYSQLENRIIGTEVDEYMDGTLGQVESRGFQTPTNYASSDSTQNYDSETIGDSATLTDGLENFVGYFIDSYEYEIYFSVDGTDLRWGNISFTPSGGLTGVNGLNIPTDPEDTSSEEGSKTVLLSDSANFDPIQVTESDPFSFSYDVSGREFTDASYTVEYMATFNVATNIPHNHEFDYAN